MEKLLLGIDIGTSSCKLALISENGSVVDVAKSDYELFSYEGGRFEQNAEEYWGGTLLALSELEKRNKGILSRVAAIGVIGQTSTEIFVDKSGVPLRPAIIWKDTRATKEAEMIRRDFGEEKLHKLLGIDVPITPNWAASRLLWISRNEPTVARNTYKILQPKDYVNFKLTGKYFSDKWINKSVVNSYTGEVPEEYINYLGFSPEVIPKTYAPFEVAGAVSDEIALLTGLSAGTPVVAGWSDGPATMLGSGAFLKEGIAFNCTGTSEIIGISTKSAKYVKGLMTLPEHITGSVAIIYGPTQSGSSSLLWYLSKIRERNEFSEAVKLAESVPAGAGGLVFLPYLAGERAPIWDADAKGSFVNINSNHENGDFVRAIMEGVAFSVRHCLETAEASLGITAEDVVISGGGSKIPVWNQIRADANKKRVVLTDSAESSALGAVILAAVGVGIFENLQKASAALVKLGKVYEPNPESYAAYDKNYKCYRALYGALKSIKE